MNKKIVIICSIVVTILIVIIGYVSYSLFYSKDVENIDNEFSDHLSAIPSDAVFLMEFDSFNEVESAIFNPSSHFNSFLRKGGGLNGFLTLSFDKIKDSKGVFSLHYSSRNKVDMLMVFDLLEDGDKKTIASSLVDRCKGVIQKRYGGHLIYKCTIPNISFAIYDKFLLMSSSMIVLESSIRHLDEKSSIMDIPSFQEIYKYKKGPISIFLNHSNVGKLFSGCVNYPYLKYSSFVNYFAEWSCFNLSLDKKKLLIEGFSISDSGIGNYSSLLSTQEGSKSDLYQLIPFNTFSLISLNISNPAVFIDGYCNYIEYHKLERDYNYLLVLAKKEAKLEVSVRDWFLSLGVEHVAKASLLVNGEVESLLLVKADNVAKFDVFSGKLISRLLGGVFEPSSNDYYSIVKNWVVIGSEANVKKIVADNTNPNYFSFDKYISQTAASEHIENDGVIDSFVNLNSLNDSIGVVLKDDYAENIKNGLGKFNFNFYNMSIKPYKNNVRYKASLIVDNVVVEGFYDENIVVEVPKGPFSVKNFINGKTNYLEQLENNKLRLLDDKKKGVWTVPFETPLCGTVGQIDYLNNNKLQMIFASGSSLFLMDRLGNIVKNFPIKLKGGEVLLGPTVYDFNDNRNYTLMVLHSDNTLRIYNKNGQPIGGWNVISPQEKILSLPELLVVGDNRYWVVRLSQQTQIFNSDGVPVAEFANKKRLAIDTKITPSSQSSVVVTTIDGKEQILDLLNGNFKLKK